jgi:hypothetical protein
LRRLAAKLGVARAGVAGGRREGYVRLNRRCLQVLGGADG